MQKLFVQLKYILLLLENLSQSRIFSIRKLIFLVALFLAYFLSLNSVNYIINQLFSDFIAYSTRLPISAYSYLIFKNSF